MLGNIHYSDETLRSIIECEVKSTSFVHSFSIKLEKTNNILNTVQLDITLSTKENIIHTCKNLQQSIISTIQTMTELQGIKVNIHITKLK